MEYYKEVNFNKKKRADRGGEAFPYPSLPSVKSTPEIVGIADI